MSNEAAPSQCPYTKAKVKGFVTHCDQYKKADNKKAVFQLLNTFIPFLAICAAMIYSFSEAYWITALLTIPASLLLVRVFIIQHDCGHGSFFTTRKWNNRIGRLMSLFTLTPYDFWRRTHNMHHSSSGNLDNRGFGAIETITVAEYEALDAKTKFWYRIYRNPYILLLLGTPYYTLIGQRMARIDHFPFFEYKKSITRSQIWKSVHGLNLTLFIVFGLLGLMFGLLPVLVSYIPVLIVTSWAGGWLFFIQHQFEDTYYEYEGKWDYSEAAVLGSSYYDLHPILQWFTGNIGLHHIHHLNGKIPNYRLQECMDSEPELKKVNRITFLESFKLAKLALWDERQNKMIGFSALS